jgi:hypothetical protein
MNRLAIRLAGAYHRDDCRFGYCVGPDKILLGDETIIEGLNIIQETLNYLPEEDVDWLYARYLSSLNL